MLPDASRISWNCAWHASINCLPTCCSPPEQSSPSSDSVLKSTLQAGSTNHHQYSDACVRRLCVCTYVCACLCIGLCKQLPRSRASTIHLKNYMRTRLSVDTFVHL